jgi:hypothetical protein
MSNGLECARTHICVSETDPNAYPLTAKKWGISPYFLPSRQGSRTPKPQRVKGDQKPYRVE